MNTKEISKLYIFNAYISTIPILAIFILFFIQLFFIQLFTKERIDLIIDNLIGLMCVIVSLPFINLIINVISLRKKTDFWNMLYFIANVILIICLIVFLTLEFASAPFLIGEPGVILGFILAILAILASWLFYLANIAKVSLIDPMVILCLILLGYLIYKGYLSNKTFLIFIRIIYIILLLASIILAIILKISRGTILIL